MPDKAGEIAVRFAEALVNAVAYYGDKGETEKIPDCLDRIEELFKEHPAFVSELYARVAILLSRLALEFEKPDLLVKAWKFIFNSKTVEEYRDAINDIKKRVEAKLAEEVDKNPNVVNLIKNLDDAAILLNTLFDKLKNNEARRKVLEIMKS